ncbi:uncharacterized protein LOC113363704 [Ctenocephalides felis]|uniref:uncharacterized protein LOC113363704 n=1 Tax=Ctenocephalides felis TaxID=7515 RepID=UPI000E6E3363|nr:uncharacterized protein LOC113363704 [Ctenocephalides felis]
MKFSLVVFLACAIVATTLAAAPNSQRQKKDSDKLPGVRKNENHERAAAPHPAPRANNKGAKKTQARAGPPAPNPDKTTSEIDLQTAVKSAFDAFAPLAKDGSSLAVDAVKSFLGDNKARNSPANLQKRAAKLATDSFNAVRDFTPTVNKLVQTYVPKALETASKTLDLLGF